MPNKLQKEVALTGFTNYNGRCDLLNLCRAIYGTNRERAYTFIRLDKIKELRAAYMRGNLAALVEAQDLLDYARERRQPKVCAHCFRPLHAMPFCDC